MTTDNNRTGSVCDITDPLVLNFIAIIGEEGVVDFDVIEQREFMKFWSSIAIHRYEDEDFTCIFYGTLLVKYIGIERTGSKVLALKDHKFNQEVFDNLLEVHTTKKPVYLFGSLEGNERGHINWQQVKMPLRRKGELNEVLSLLSFSPHTY
jgi:hypothetical protein